MTDQGDGFDDPLAGHLSSRGRDPRRVGMGLWLVRQLGHQVEPRQAPKPAPRRDDPAGGSGGEPR